MRRLFGFVIFLFFLGKYNAAILVVEGKYQKKNVFVQNAYSNSGVGFCVQEIKVNGRITTDETNSFAFEIDLASLNLKYGDRVMIEILHKDDCTPKVLNMDDLRPKPTFEILSINVNRAGILKWTTKNESGELPFIIEQFKWKKWIPIGEIAGVGTPDNHEYSFEVMMHSGENKYRVKQKGVNSITRTSQEVTVKSTKEKPSFAIAGNNNGIDFSSDTGYEIYDAYGVIVKRGYGKNVRTDDLSKGMYYICYDNLMTEFKK